MGRTSLQYGSRIVAAIACGYLGLLGSIILLGAPLLTASVISGGDTYHVFASGGLVQVLGRPMGEMQGWVQGVYRLAPAILAIVLLVAGPLVVQRLGGWPAIGALHLFFWCGMAFSESVLAASLGRGPLSDLIRFVGVPHAGTASSQMAVAAAAGLFAAGMVYLCLPYFAGGESTITGAARELGWRFVLPVAVLAMLLPPPGIDLWQRFAGVPYAPLVFAAGIAGIAVLRRGRNAGPAMNVSLAGSGYAVCLAGAVAALTFGLPDWNPTIEERPATELRASAHWELQFEKAGVTPADQTLLLAAADGRLAAAAERLGIAIPSEPLRATVRTTEDRRSWFRGRRRGEQRQRERERQYEYRLMPSGDLPDARIEPRLLMASSWGEPGYEPLANAVARFAAGDYLGHPLWEYARRITCEEGAYDLGIVLDLRNEYLSPIVRDALGGAWIESLDASGETLKRIYSFPLTPGNTAELGVLIGGGWDGLEARWRELLTSGEVCEPSAPDPPPQRIAWHKGVAFSHEMGGGWGYGSESAEKELARIRSIGGNSVAIIPYAFTRAPEAPSISFRTDETDERIIRTIEQAHRAGLAAVLKPQIWARQFTGDIQLPSRDEFEIWWAQYRRWLLHFARLGALYRAEMLVIGTELGGMTRFERPWRELIRDIRAIYPGELAYAANWHDEFEAVKFWDALDYVSVNFYFPLAEGEGVKPSEARLNELARVVESVASQYGKRVIFTEVGYPSVATAAQQPWEETGAALDPDLQSECYEAVFRAFANRPWFAGFYWWKWPSHGSGGAFDGSFSPLGKPALDVLAKWYRGERGSNGSAPAENPAENARGSAGR